LAKTGWVTLGEVTKIRGVKGELVVTPWSDKLNRFADLEEVFLGEESPKVFRVQHARAHQGKVLLQLKGIETPQQARVWVGSLVQMPAERLPVLSYAEFYVHELIGMEVYTEDGEKIGQIKEIISNPGNDIFRITKEGKEYYLPATKGAVLKVELPENKIIVKKDFVVEQ
jgi:16S rRNA processing protein RimM